MRTQHQTFMDHLIERWTSSRAGKNNHLPELIGCSDAEIEEMRIRQCVHRLPELYIEMMQRFGKQMVLLMRLYRDQMLYPTVLSAKEDTFEIIRRRSNCFVMLHDADGDYSLFFDVTNDDPIIYRCGLDDTNPASFDLIVEPWSNLSDLLIDIVEDAIEVYNKWHPSESSEQC